MKTLEIHPGVACFVFENDTWVRGTVNGSHKTPGISRPGPRRFDVALADGTVVTREAKQLRPAPAPIAPAAPKPEVTAADVFRHQLDVQKGRTLRSAEDLLSQVQSFVERLRAGDIPTTSLNINAVGFVMTDHAQLLALESALAVATSK